MTRGTVPVQRQMALFDEAALPTPARTLPEADLPSRNLPERSLKASARQVPVFSAQSSVAEAERLMAEGVRLRYANTLRRLSSATALPPPQQPSDLVPAHLVRWPDGWVCTPQGYSYALTRADAKAISRHINSKKEELGVFACHRQPDGSSAFLVEY